MKVLLASAGSRGDVVPFAALAAGLQAAGHSVRLLTHRSLLDAVPAGIPTTGVSSDPGRLLRGPAADALRRGDLRALNRARREFAEFLSAFHEPAAEAAADADVLIASTFALAAVHAAMAQRVPVIRAHMWPESPGLAGPMPLLPFSWLLPGPLRWALRGCARRAEPYLAGFDGGWKRGRLRLRAHHPVGLSTNTLGTLLAVSPRLLPDGPLAAQATGWWWGSGEERLSDRALAATSGTRSCIAVGFGSMPQAHPAQLLDAVDWAAARLGVRALVQHPVAAGVESEHVVGIGPEPHAALFERVCLVVHHGGSGTTGAVTRAGVPSVVVPHFADQYYWAHRLSVTGLAPRMLPATRLDRGGLARAIEAGLASGMRRRSTEFGALIRAEDGTADAVRRIVAAVERQSVRRGVAHRR